MPYDAARILSKQAATIHRILVQNLSKNHSKIDEFLCMAGIQPHDPSKIRSRAPQGRPKEDSGAPQEGPGPLPRGLGSSPGPSQTLKLGPSWSKMPPSWSRVGSWEPSWSHLGLPGLPPGPPGTLQGPPGPARDPPGSPTDPLDRLLRGRFCVYSRV